MIVLSSTLSCRLAITGISRHQRLPIRCLSTDRQRVRWWERLRDFGKSAKLVLGDCLRAKDIYDASRTPRNEWTNQYRIMGKVPRRQQEQVRQLAVDAKVAVPIILLWLPPVIGFLPLLLAMVAPRQVLTRQFFNDYELELFSAREMDQRTRYYPALSEHVWASLNLNHRGVELPILGKDAAGPVWDLAALFGEFCKTDLVHCENLPREHMNTLALASGYGQRFPNPLPSVLVSFLPRMVLSRALNETARHIWRDDDLCIEEHYHTGACEGMTDSEVREACLLRGLPVNGSPGDMRECMTNHLCMMEKLWKSKPDAPQQHCEFFAMHLPALRQESMKRQ